MIPLDRTWRGSVVDELRSFVNEGVQMSRPLRTIALAMAAVVAVPAGVPASASADQARRQSSNRVLYVVSEAFPAGQTRPSKQDASFMVIAENKQAKRLELTVDGRREPDRYFSQQGTRGRTEFALSPGIGWHELGLTIIDADGSRSTTRKYSFGVRPASITKTATSAAPTVGGRFTEPDGSPAGNVPVAIYPVLPASHDRMQSELTPLATTTTANDGNWNVTLVSAPKHATDAAAANDGVLNLQAVAEGVAQDPESGELRQMTGVSSFATGIAVGGRMSDAAVEATASGVPTAPLLPVRRLSELPRSPEDAPPADVKNPATGLTAEQAQYNEPVYFGEADVTGKAVDDTAVARRIGSSDYTNQRVNPVTSRDAARLTAAAVTPNATGDEATSRTHSSPSARRERGGTPRYSSLTPGRIRGAASITATLQARARRWVSVTTSARTGQ